MTAAEDGAKPKQTAKIKESKEQILPEGFSCSPKQGRRPGKGLWIRQSSGED